MDTPTLEATEVRFTESAAVKVASLLAEENNPKLNLRVYVRGGGCHGLEYGFIFDEIQEDDIISENKLPDGTGIKLLVDPFSYQYLAGAEIHYDDENIEARFIIRGLKAKTTCGCGSSFSVDDD